MSHRKRLFIAGYLMTIAALCLVYAVIPFVPAVAWKVQEARESVHAIALRRAVTKYRVKRIMETQRNPSRIPESAMAESVSGVLPQRREMGVGGPFEATRVDRQVSDLLKTLSATAMDGPGSRVAKSVASPGVQRAASKRPSRVEKGTQTSQKSQSSSGGVRAALAAPPVQGRRGAKTRAQSGVPKPRGNSILIPSLKVDMEVLEGGEDVLNRGAWLIPGSAYPGQGNTVVSAHRYQSFGSKSFYHLDKVRAGDAISVWWKGKEYRYRAVSNYVVKPDQVDVLNKSSRPQLTLITCDPVFSTARRRIVTADLVSE